MDPIILEQLAERISRRCGLGCRVYPQMENPKYAYNENRSQYDSKVILKRLHQCSPQDAVRMIGVTHVDIYVPILKYVFGLAEIEGQYSIISIHRLCPEFYDQRPNLDLLLERMEKTALHELGHTFGLTHCRDHRCVMHSSTHIEHTDFKLKDFCLTCLELFRWSLEKNLASPSH